MTTITTTLQNRAARVAGFLALFLMAGNIYAATVSVTLYSTAQPAQNLGRVTAKDTPFGLLLTPQLQHLPPGVHGFHVHQNASCAQHGMAAGGHFDPAKTGKHLGPYNTHGHLGDLPVLIVDKKGDATLPVLAPRLKVTDLLHHALMIHAAGDNYSDQPKKLGGGGARIACGVFPKVASSLH